MSTLGPSIRKYVIETLEKMQFSKVRVCGTLTCAPWAVHDAVDKIDQNSSTSSLTRGVDNFLELGGLINNLLIIHTHVNVFVY